MFLNDQKERDWKVQTHGRRLRSQKYSVILESRSMESISRKAVGWDLQRVDWFLKEAICGFHTEQQR